MGQHMMLRSFRHKRFRRQNHKLLEHSKMAHSFRHKRFRKQNHKLLEHSMMAHNHHSQSFCGTYAALA